MMAAETAEIRPVACQVGRCGDYYANPGQMAAHLARDHGSTPRVALVNARRMFGFTTEPPPKEFALPPRMAARTPRRDKSRANPAACLYCARMRENYGTLCRRHGGPSHGTSWRLRKVERAS